MRWGYCSLMKARIDRNADALRCAFDAALVAGAMEEADNYAVLIHVVEMKGDQDHTDIRWSPTTPPDGRKIGDRP
jgi:hypothetical protein